MLIQREFDCASSNMVHAPFHERYRLEVQIRQLLGVPNRT